MKRRGLPLYVGWWKDRHGKMRMRFRKTGAKLYYFKRQFGTPEFEAEYAACLAGEAAPKIEIGAARIKRGTVSDLLNRYYRAPEFLGLAESTKATYRNQLERFRTEHGDKPVHLIERRHIKSIIGKMADRPGAANSLLARLKLLMRFAMDEELRKDNPALGIKGFKKGEGFHSWTEDEIAQFEARHPIGTKERLAFALLLNTGQRRSDVVRMGHQHVKAGMLAVRQQKTGRELQLPLLPDLKAAIAALPRDNLTFLVTGAGKPFSAAGFGNWFREACNAAGLTQCSAHGLRKAMARRLAEAANSNQQIKAITGHQTEAEVARYTKAAEQERLAKQAMASLTRKGKRRTSMDNPS